MNYFFNSLHCLSLVHCKACRSKEDNSFRQSLKVTFDDIDKVQFACPHGKPWGDKNKVKLVGTKVYKNGHRCRKCESRIKQRADVKTHETK